VFELDAAQVEADRGALEDEKTFRRKGPGCFHIRGIVDGGREILVAGHEVLRICEREKVAVERGAILAVMPQPPLEYPLIGDGLGVAQLDGIRADAARVA